MTNMYNKEEAGRSMVEMLGVLAIVGVLSIGGISGYSKAMAKYKVNKTLDQISMLVTNVRSTFGNQNSYEGLNEASLIAYNLVDKDMSLGSTSKLYNPYNGSVEVTTTNDARAFVISYANIPTDACANIASSNWGDSAASGLVSLEVGTSTHNWASTDADKGLPIKFGEAAKECNSNASAGYITLKWTYY